MNRHLLALLPPREHILRHQNTSGTYSATAVMPNPVQQSPRVYAALMSGGGVIRIPSVAKTLQARGFVVQSIELTASEASWFSRALEMDIPAGQAAFLVQCPTGIRMVDGQPMCGAGATLTPIPFAEAEKNDFISDADLAPALEVASGLPIHEVLVYTTDKKGYGSGDFQLARRTVSNARQIGHDLTLLEQVRAQGTPIPPEVDAEAFAARSTLAAIAQPVAMFLKAFPDGEMPPQPAEFQGEDEFGVAPVVLYYTIMTVAVCITIIAAVYYLSESSAKVADVTAKLGEGLKEVLAPLAACVADPALSPEQRAVCAKQMEDITTHWPQPPKDPIVAGTEMLKAVLPIVGIAALAIYAGPLIKEITSLGAETVRARRQQSSPQGGLSNG